MRPIDADELIKYIEENNTEREWVVNKYNADWIWSFIESAPTIDTEPVRHGHWVICSDGYYPYCSKCKQEPSGKNMTNYCPHCGAKMDEVSE